MNPTPVVLYGEHIRLEPLDTRHAGQLFEESQLDEIWQFMPVPRPAREEDVVDLIDKAWRAAAEGVEVPFAIIVDRTDRAVGSIRFLEIRRADRGVEIGWTWLGAETRGTIVQTESIYLLLRHAFDDLGALRVQFRADGRDVAGQTALEGLGAVREGTLRQQRLMWDGVYRDTVYYSVLAAEWPEAKGRLEGLLGR